MHCLGINLCLSLENPQLGWGVQKSLKLCVIVLNKKNSSQFDRTSMRSVKRN